MQAIQSLAQVGNEIIWIFQPNLQAESFSFLLPDRGCPVVGTVKEDNQAFKSAPMNSPYRTAPNRLACA